jgi:hypothetical protein
MNSTKNIKEVVEVSGASNSVDRDSQVDLQPERSLTHCTSIGGRSVQCSLATFGCIQISTAVYQ